MNTNTRLGIFVLVIVLIGIALYMGRSYVQAPGAPSSQQATTTTQGGAYAQTTSDGTITFGTPSDFGLATSQEQILVHSYIPPCDAPFNYCLYYNGTDYQGTNFESAGLAVRKRTDLSAERLCLDTPPAGYESSVTPSNTKSGDEYSSSVFGNIGQGAAGHTAAGSLYRLFVRGNSSCYEFETRVGQSQFGNYPAGSIKEFTKADEQAVMQKLTALLGDISLASGAKNLFPAI